MRILFVVEAIDEKCGANVNIACDIARNMKEHHEVDVLSQKFSGDAPTELVKSSFSKLYLFDNKVGDELTGFIEKNNWNDISPFQKIQLLLKKGLLGKYVDYYYLNNRYLRRKYKQEIEHIAGEKSYDAVIVFCMPHFLADSLAEAGINAKKGIYQMDPYTFHQLFDRRFELLRRKVECGRISKTDFFITTPPVLKEFHEKGMRADYGKIAAQDFPLIRKPDYSFDTGRDKDKKTIDFFFVGNFYSNIRNPRFLLRLFEKLPEKYVLHIVGKGAEDEIEKSSLYNTERLVLHGWVSPETARQFLQNSDVLVNINNKISNMLPSKVYEYISTGKPIINICQFSDCPTIDYMKRYGNAISLVESENISDEVLQEVEAFVSGSCGNLVSFEDVRERFQDATIEHAVKLIEELIS